MPATIRLTTAAVLAVGCASCRQPPAPPPPRQAVPAPRLPPPSLPPAAVPSPAPPAEVPDHPTAYDVSPTAPQTIAPNTPVSGDGPPAGWSHLVIRGKPRVRAAEAKKVSGYVGKMAGWMFTAFAADVAPAGQGGYTLRAVGLGLGTAVDGTDTVVGPDADVGFVGRQILSAGYDRQKASAVVRARGPAFAVVDTPVWFADRGKHRLHTFRYALVVDKPTGRLDAYVWRLGPDGGLADPTAVKLDPHPTDPAELVVDAGEVSFIGTPSEAAFAVDRLPPCGTPLALPADLRAVAAANPFAPADAAALDAGLRRLTAGR